MHGKFVGCAVRITGQISVFDTAEDAEVSLGRMFMPDERYTYKVLELREVHLRPQGPRKTIG